SLVARPQVDVQPVLDRLLLGDPQEQQVRCHTVFGTALRWFQHDFVLIAYREAPAERRLPERGQPGRVGGVDAQALDADVRAATLRPLPPLSSCFPTAAAAASTPALRGG